MSYWVMNATYHRQHLDFALIPWWQFIQLHLKTLRFHAETKRVRFGRGHPDIRMGSVSHAGPDRNAFQLRGQNVEHSLPIYEGSCAKRNRELITDLYINQDKKLSEVMEFMRSEHSFAAT